MNGFRSHPQAGNPRGIAAALAVSLAMSWPAFASQTVQIEVQSLLNARPVTILNGGKLVAWTEGLDGAYSGEATTAAAKLMGDAVPKALPDDGRFPATAKHPEVILHFSNEDATGMQVRRSMGADTFSFAVPAGRYSRMSLFCMSANGSSNLTVQLFYGQDVETRNLTVPDWYNLLPEGDPVRYYLAYDLAKWTKDNKKSEPDHHYLFGLDLAPDAGKTLTRIKLGKGPGGALTFWGATGVLEGSTGVIRQGPAHIRSWKTILGTARDGLGRRARIENRP
jgi:hypothetical protein